MAKLGNFLIKPNWSDIPKELGHVVAIGQAIVTQELIKTFTGALMPETLKVEPESRFFHRLWDCSKTIRLIFSHVVWDIVKRTFLLIIAAIGGVFSLLTLTLAAAWVIIQAIIGVCFNGLYLLINNLLIHTLIMGVVSGLVILSFALPVVFIDTIINTTYFMVNNIIIEGILFGIATHLVLSLLVTIPSLIDGAARRMLAKNLNAAWVSIQTVLYNIPYLFYLVPSLLLGTNKLQWSHPLTTSTRFTATQAWGDLKDSLYSMLEVLRSTTLLLPATLVGATALRHNNGELKRYQPKDENGKQGESWFLGFKVHVWSAITEAWCHLLPPLSAFYSCVSYIFTQPIFMTLRLGQGAALTLLLAEKLVMSAPVKLVCSIRRILIPPPPSSKITKLPEICSVLKREGEESQASYI